MKTRFQIGDNTNLFDITYVRNLAHAHLLAVEALLQTSTLKTTLPLDTERVDGEAFFITNGTPVYFWDACRRAWQARNLPEDKEFDMARVWVLGTTMAMVIATLLELIMGIFGRSPNFTRVAVKNSAMTRYFNIEKARRRLGYQPIWSLDEGITKGVAECMARIRREEESKKTK